MNLHRDRHNKGDSLIIEIMGGPDCSGGGLWVSGLGKLEIREWTKFDGNIPHGPLPSTGERYSIVLYTNSDMKTASRDDLEVPCRLGLCTARLLTLCFRLQSLRLCLTFRNALSSTSCFARSKRASSAFAYRSRPSWPRETRRPRAVDSSLRFGMQQNGPTSRSSAVGCRNRRKASLTTSTRRIRSTARTTARVRTRGRSCP